MFYTRELDKLEFAANQIIYIQESVAGMFRKINLWRFWLNHSVENSDTIKMVIRKTFHRFTKCKKTKYCFAGKLVSEQYCIV